MNPAHAYTPYERGMDALLSRIASDSPALALYRALGDRLGEANVLRATGDMQRFHTEMDAALNLIAQANAGMDEAMQ